MIPLDCADYWWPNRGTSQFDIARAIDEAHDLGFTEVIAQDGMGAQHWIEPHRDAIKRGGLRLSIGLGMDGAWDDAQTGITAICNALDADPDCRVYPDDERAAKWETAAGRALVWSISQGVFAHYSVGPDPVRDTDAEALRRAWVRARIRQAGWWAPLSITTGDGHVVPTHPGAPHQAWASLCATQYPQTYGAPVRFASLSMLAHSRDSSQYQKLGTLASAIFPTFQAYGRDVPDVVRSMMLEPRHNEWDRIERDARNRAGRLAALALAGHGYLGPGAVGAYQQVAGLDVDDLCGEETCRALGVAWPG